MSKSYNGIKCSNKYLIFLYFNVGPSLSSSIPVLLTLAFDAGHCCQCSCPNCCCCHCQCRHCHCPHCCCCTGVCVFLPSHPFIAQDGCCLLFCLCCWHLCRTSLFWLIVVSTTHCRGCVADDNTVYFQSGRQKMTMPITKVARRKTMQSIPMALRLMTMPPIAMAGWLKKHRILPW
jgi:hypothetical protein